jgi:prepilin-type N-terminal cleavage/methylation domain-containing protein
MKKGFTLIELAIVLVIIGLLIGVGVSLLPGLINQQKYAQNQSLLNQNYNALIGYIMANGKAPLASSNTNGISSQSQNIGYLPYVTIGGLQKDAYGNTFYYAVNNRPLNISINGATATSMSLTSTNSINNFCAVLYALNYYYNNNPPTLGASDVRTINSPNQTAYTPDVFVLISSGANNKLDSPNTITNPNGVFASQQYPLSQNYDDIVEALSITNAIGQFCANNPANQFSVTYTNSVYYLNSTLSNSNNTNSGSQNPPNNAYAQCVSNCNTNLWCFLTAIFYGGCYQACTKIPNFCQ